MIKAIQELSEKNQVLSKENQQLKSVLHQLQQDVATIKSKL
jgi:FtsZ-binding cell division protein ZapB